MSSKKVVRNKKITKRTRWYSQRLKCTCCGEYYDSAVWRGVDDNSSCSAGCRAKFHRQKKKAQKTLDKIEVMLSELLSDNFIPSPEQYNQIYLLRSKLLSIADEYDYNKPMSKIK